MQVQNSGVRCAGDFSTGLKVGPGDLRGLLQPERFHDLMAFLQWGKLLPGEVVPQLQTSMGAGTGGMALAQPSLIQGQKIPCCRPPAGTGQAPFGAAASVGAGQFRGVPGLEAQLFLFSLSSWFSFIRLALTVTCAALTDQARD